MVTIIVPLFNSAKYIGDLIESILSQSLPPRQVIFKDGVSTDNTLEIVRCYISKLLEKQIIVDVISRPDFGIYDAMNIAIAQASSEFVLFMGCDDLFYSNNSLQLFQTFLKEKTAVYYANSFFKKRKIIYDGRFNRFKLSKRNICHQSILYPTHLLKSNLYDITFKLKADYDLNIRLWSKVRFIYCDFCFTVFNDDASSGNNEDSEFEYKKFSLIIRYLGILPFVYARASRMASYLLRSIKI
jgi:glycosyltransferase involved in cell wall biosynthesis